MKRKRLEPLFAGVDLQNIQSKYDVENKLHMTLPQVLCLYLIFHFYKASQCHQNTHKLKQEMTPLLQSAMALCNFHGTSLNTMTCDALSDAVFNGDEMSTALRQSKDEIHLLLEQLEHPIGSPSDALDPVSRDKQGDSEVDRAVCSLLVSHGLIKEENGARAQEKRRHLVARLLENTDLGAIGKLGALTLGD